MGAHERAFQPSEYDRFLLLILEQGNTLSILIDEYARATGVAFAMLKNKIYYLLSNLEPLHKTLAEYLSEDLSHIILHHFDSLLHKLDEPKALKTAHKAYYTHLESLTGGNT